MHRNTVRRVNPSESAVRSRTDAATPPTRRRARAAFAAFGPAFIASVAYIDPGNFATNVTAGANTAPC